RVRFRLAGVRLSAGLAQSSAWRGRWPDITGYVWLGARYYNPESGTFLNSDPVWNGGDPNYYTFAGGDPINNFDPDGTCLERDLQNLYHEYVANQYVASQAAAFSVAMETGDISRLLKANGVDDFFNDVVAGALKGDYATDAGRGAALGQIGVGFTPAGFAAGARDVS